MQNVPWWGVVSSGIAPVLLVGGWTAATRLQPPSFDPVADTVSSLAAVGAAHRWVMTLTFVVVAVCNLVTAAALRLARRAGRLILAAGSVVRHTGGAEPRPLRRLGLHAVWASIGFGGMAL